MSDIAVTKAPRSPVRGTQWMGIRVYGVTPSGQRYDLPPDVPVPPPGTCLVPGCSCGGVRPEPVGWEVRVHWTADPGVPCPEPTVHPAEDENQALDAAVSILDGARHPWLPVRAHSAEIRPAGGTWRTVASDRPRAAR